MKNNVIVLTLLRMFEDSQTVNFISPVFFSIAKPHVVAYRLYRHKPLMKIRRVDLSVSVHVNRTAVNQLILDSCCLTRRGRRGSSRGRIFR